MAPCNNVRGNRSVVFQFSEVCIKNTGVHTLFSKFSVLSYFTRKVHNLRQNLEAKTRKEHSVRIDRVKSRLKP